METAAEAERPPALDAMEEEVRCFLEPDETAAQLLARTFVQPLRTGLPLVDRFTAFRGGQVLEIASAAGAGRTTALLQVAATCILPEVNGGVAYGGRGGHVLLFDLDGKLDIVRLLQMLEARIYQAQQAARVPPDVDLVLQGCLPRLHVVRCHSSFDFLASLRTLRPTLDGLAAAPGGLACLLIDNIAAYYYLDKVARGPPAGYAGRGLGPGGDEDITQQGAPLSLHRVHAAIVAELRVLQRRHRVPIIATKHLLLPGGKDADRQADGWPHREVMPRPWQELVTHRLLLRAESSSSSSGGGGVYAASGPAGGRGAPTRLARWHTPEEPAVIAFDIDAAGIHICGPAF